MRKFFVEHVVYPGMELLKGNKVREYTQELKATQSISAEDLKKLQEGKLKKLLNECRLHVPAYQSYGLDEAAIEQDPFAVLKSLKPLDKALFKADPDSFINTTYDKSTLISNASGGSTGQPLRFYMDRYDVEHFEAARWRALAWYGVSNGSPTLHITGNRVELDQAFNQKNAKRDRLLKNRTLLSAYELGQEHAAEYVKMFAEIKPEYVFGYASSLEIMARILLENGTPVEKGRIKCVVSTAETLHDFQKEMIEKAFNAPCVNEYGARDGGIIAYACPCGKMHITAENLIFELLDPITLEPVPAGTSGLVCITDLNNLCQPRLRYLLGDTATMSAESGPCSNGITLPRLESIEGRQEEILKLPGGKLIHGHFLYNLCLKYPQIVKVRLTQDSETHADLTAITDDPAALESFAEDVRKIIPEVTIDTAVVDDIPLPPSGKHRNAVRTFPL